jgi:elongation factor Ts
MGIDMNLLKQLREATFAPLKDCKDALVEAEWNLDKAKDILKEKWILKAGKKSDRETNEWTVKVFQKDWKIAWVKLLCETDFVAKNEWFNELCDNLLNKLLSQDETFSSKEAAPSNLVEELDIIVKEGVWSLWENMQLSEIILTKDNWFVYNHPWNKVASIVFFDWEDDSIAKEIALQVAAMNPIYLDFDSVPSDSIKELEVKFRQELLESGKPENMIDQILKWKLSKALAEDVLLEQEYIRDGSKKIKDIMPEWFKINSYLRLSVK